MERKISVNCGKISVRVLKLCTVEDPVDKSRNSQIEREREEHARGVYFVQSLHRGGSTVVVSFM